MTKTNYRNKLDSEADPQIAAVARYTGFELGVSVTTASSEKLTYNNLYWFLDWLNLQYIRSIITFAYKQKIKKKTLLVFDEVSSVRNTTINVWLNGGVY